MPFSPEEEARFEHERDERKRTFDSVSTQYAAARPDYPEALFDAVVKLARLPFDARLLEIGAGPGIATHHFARRGYRITALEPGDALAAVARRRLADYHLVKVVNQTFEAWPLEQGGYDLVFAAQAFHWVDRSVAYGKTAAALRPGGGMALFWNRPVDEEAPISRALDDAYRRHAPTIARDEPAAPLEEWAAYQTTRIDESGLFNPVIFRTFPWKTSYSAAQYVALLGTYSDHIALPRAARQTLFDAVTRVIADHGGTLRRQYVAALFFATVA